MDIIKYYPKLGNSDFRYKNVKCGKTKKIEHNKTI